ncbi:MAG TPA: inositol monophosphatase family protein [Paracoccaceae bacterium]|nr:inositol monophosphatase family protein [Paracoccaceae bacterium]
MLPELLGIALQVSDAAHYDTIRLFRSDALATQNKADSGFDPVTEADRNAEIAMRELLADLRPDDAILGEEFGEKPGTTGLRWVIDPIDGTRGFMSGTPTWGVLVGLENSDGPMLGVIDQPFTGEKFFGYGDTALWTRDDEKCFIKTRACEDLSSAILYTTFPEIGSDAEYAAFRNVSKESRLTRYGLDCYAYALLAAGQIDLVIEAGLNAYDVVAPIAVIEAAGGIVTDWRGGKAHEGGRLLAAGDARVHAQALEILSKAE